MELPFAQLVVDGLAMGVVYVLLASGFNLIISTPKILFIAYGEFYMLGAYILWGLVNELEFPFLVALCLAILATAILGGIVYRLIFQRIAGHFMAIIVAAIGLMMLMSQAIMVGFGTESKSMASVFTGMINIGGIRISIERVVLIILTLAVLVGLHLFLQKTKFGRAMRAVSFNADVAALQGVNSNMTNLVTMVLGCALAGFAGGIMTPVFAIHPTMGAITFVVLLVVMLGGIGSMVGAIVAGLVLGVTLSFGQYTIGGGVAQILFFLVVGIIIFFRPGGILGQPAEEMVP